MVDIAWPADLRPVSTSFYLQPHVGGSESPLTRTRKVYGLSAPRWIAKLSLRHRSWGRGSEALKAGRVEALIADLEGGLNNALLWDFRREASLRPMLIASPLMTASAAAGATQLTISGFSPYAWAFSAGDYVGGDGRPHIVRQDTFADASGVAIVPMRPPLRAPLAAAPAVIGRVPGRFKLTSDDAGLNETVARERTTWNLDFIEDLS